MYHSCGAIYPYIPAPSHYMQNDTPLENVLAMYRAPRGSA